jgi:hypothetical protein
MVKNKYKNPTNEEEFTTQDLNLCAVLISRGFNLNNLIKDSTGKATFNFNNSESLQNTIHQYWNNELLVNPQDLFNALKFLKNRIYSNY